MTGRDLHMVAVTGQSGGGCAVQPTRRVDPQDDSHGDGAVLEEKPLVEEALLP